MSDQCDALSASITVVAQILVGDSTLEETLRRVADLANETISGSDMVSVAVLVEGRPRTVAFTDVTAPEIDDAQYHTGIGPCLDAVGCRQGQRVDSTENDERWPPFAEPAAAHGVLSSLSLPLVARHAAIGALNWYSRRAAAFSVDDERIGSGFAAAAAIAVANAHAPWDARHLSERLGLAMQSRATIEQAKGTLIAEQHCDADRAFEMQVRAAQRENRELGVRLWPSPGWGRSGGGGAAANTCGVGQQRTDADHAGHAAWPASLTPAVPADPAHPDRIGRDRP
jgi:GAF domain-containing protein